MRVRVYARAGRVSTVAAWGGGAGGGARRGSVRMISDGVSTRMCASASRSPPAVTVTLGARTVPLGGAACCTGGAGDGAGAGGACGTGGAGAGAGLGERPPSASTPVAPLELCRPNQRFISSPPRQRTRVTSSLVSYHDHPSSRNGVLNYDIHFVFILKIQSRQSS